MLKWGSAEVEMFQFYLEQYSAAYFKIRLCITSANTLMHQYTIKTAITADY